jgi:pimeloyl-ACP methyl ester carboxylesterase
VGPNTTAATIAQPIHAASARRDAGTTTARIHTVIHDLGPAGCRLGDDAVSVIETSAIITRAQPRAATTLSIYHGDRERACLRAVRMAMTSRIPPTAVLVFAGRDDSGASPSAAAAWQLRTTAAFRLVELAAGHFFLDSHRPLLIREILRDLSARLA